MFKVLIVVEEDNTLKVYSTSTDIHVQIIDRNAEPLGMKALVEPEVIVDSDLLEKLVDETR